MQPRLAKNLVLFRIQPLIARQTEYCLDLNNSDVKIVEGWMDLDQPIRYKKLKTQGRTCFNDRSVENKEDDLRHLWFWKEKQDQVSKWK